MKVESSSYDVEAEPNMNCIDKSRSVHPHRLECGQIHILLLKEALKGVSDLKAKKTLSLVELKSRHGR